MRAPSIVKDKNNQVVLFQQPNLPIIVAAISFVVGHLLSGSLSNIFLALAFGAFFTWAWLEVFQGATPIRRIMGASVIILLLASAAH